MLSVSFKSRSFADMASPAGLAFQVKGMTWAAIGGPKRATLEVQTVAGRVDMAALGGLLRAPVEIYGEDGQRIWWGLVWDVSIEEGAVGVKLSLDDLANRVRVVYGESRPEVMGTGRRATTGWAEDLASQADYGVKDGQFELALASTQQAESYRGERLASAARPVGKVSLNGAARPGTGITVKLECRGWWETLGWQRYSQAAGLVENVASGAAPVCYAIGTATNTDLTQRFVPVSGGWLAEVAWVSVKRTRYSTAGTLSVLLCAAGGTVLAHATKDIGTLPVSNPGWIALELNTAVRMEAGQTYWLQVGSSTRSDADCVRVLVDEGLGYAGGELRVWDLGSGGWVDVSTADLQFRVAGRMDTGEQIRRMAEQGQFMTGVRGVDSGLLSNPFRNGDRDLKAEIEALLTAGTSGNRRLLAEVTAERVLVVRELGEECRYQVGRDGVIRMMGGQAVRPGPGVAGEWAETGWGRVWLEEVGWSEEG